jgi:hypothetical protein
MHLIEPCSNWVVLEVKNLGKNVDTRFPWNDDYSLIVSHWDNANLLK